MGFNKVYKTLVEIFPQVDTRALRAVAIEHSKDADAAVEAVLVEILPFFSEKSKPSSPSSGNMSSGEPSNSKAPIGVPPANDAPSVKTVDSKETVWRTIRLNGRIEDPVSVNGGHSQPVQDMPSIHQGDVAPLANVVGSNEGQSDWEQLLSDVDRCSISLEGETGSIHLQGDVSHEKLEGNTIKLTVEPREVMEKDGPDYQCVVNGVPEREGSISQGKCPETCIKTENGLGVGYLAIADILKRLDGLPDSEKYNGMFTPVLIAEDVEKSIAYSSPLQVEVLPEQPDSVSVQDLEPSPSDSREQTVVPDMKESNLEKPEKSFLTAAVSVKIDTPVETSAAVDQSSLTDTVSRSDQISLMDHLETVFAEARNNKKTLFSAMETVISMMKEVEAQERAVEEAKEAAAKGGLDILTRVEELKQMLVHANEANDMHASEVYGERAILSTELRELQSRLLSLSDERDKFLGVLDEEDIGGHTDSYSALFKMRQTLEIRLAAAENERENAEQEKLEKERSAKKALADQELIMEKVVEEANKLKQQAEENNKLREFLISRGSIVDTLQGEMAVICQDVRLLKEKFDDRVPFSKSLSSSQTSCILASSSSSLKSLPFDHVECVPELVDSTDLPLTRNPERSFDEQLSEVQATRDDRKALLDDGWEFFDDAMDAENHLA